MTESTDNMSRDEAQEALDSVAKMKSAGWRRGVPERWFGATIAALIGSMFAIYALEDPVNYIVFPILALAVFTATAREKGGAHGRDIPDDKAGRWKLALFAVVLVIVFFGSIIIRRSYDAVWVPLVVGASVAIVVFMLSKRERRAYLAMADQEDAE